MIYCFYIPRITQVDLRKVAEAFYGLTMDLLLRDSEALFVDLSKSQNLLTEIRFLSLADEILKSYGMSYRWRWAIDTPTALALAKYETFEKEELPLESLVLFGTPLRKEPLLEKKILGMVNVLQQLGLRTLGDFQELRPQELSSRFGALALGIYDCVKRGFSQPWPVYLPEEQVTHNITEKIEIFSEFQIHNLEPITFVLKTLVDRILLKLKLRGKTPKIFEIVFHQEKLSVVRFPRWSLRFDLALGLISGKVLLGQIRERVEHELQRRPLESLIESVEFSVLEVAPYQEAQRNIFDPHREEKAESTWSLVNRLRLKLGTENVFQALLNPAYLPEENWHRINLGNFEQNPSKEPGKKEAQVLPDRPTRLLPKPQRISMRDQKIVSLEKSSNTVGNLGPLTILKIFEKEIILNQWWNECSERVYLKVQTQEGPLLWVFQSDQGLFLHGYFD
ncbi:MAG: hypothetical protein IPK04_13050 [Bdellovibrionales bacterium]|nr:hypothetical protein [Bdellovibrionales bacterium]